MVLKRDVNKVGKGTPTRLRMKNDWPAPKEERSIRDDLGSQIESSKQLTSSKQLYRRLKELFWSDKYEFWYYQIEKDKDGGLEVSVFSSKWVKSSAQLVGVLDEYFLGDRRYALELYERMKDSILWDEKNLVWRAFVSVDGLEVNPNYMLSNVDQLFGIIAEYFLGDKEFARELLLRYNIFNQIDVDRLTKTVLDHYYESKIGKVPAVYLHTLATLICFPEYAQVIGERLPMDSEVVVPNRDIRHRFTVEEFANVLIEAIPGNIDGARKLYSILKAPSPVWPHVYLWDKEHQLWYTTEPSEMGLGDRFYSYVQLFGALVEGVVMDGLKLM